MGDSREWSERTYNNSPDAEHFNRKAIMEGQSQQDPTMPRLDQDRTAMTAQFENDAAPEGERIGWRRIQQAAVARIFRPVDDNALPDPS
jgi:hypothetical protein